MFNEFNGYFNKDPILNPSFKTEPLCIPITLLVDKFKIGPPDESGNVINLCCLPYLFSSYTKTFPYETAAF